MLWVKEEEVAKSVGDLMASQSSEGRYSPDFEMLDAKIASALRRNILRMKEFEKYSMNSSNMKGVTYLILRCLMRRWRLP